MSGTVSDTTTTTTSSSKTKVGDELANEWMKKIVEDDHKLKNELGFHSHGMRYMKVALFSKLV